MTQSPPDGMIEGFERRQLPGDGIMIDALVGGSGPPLLLLHGYPETRMLWRQVAPLLAGRFTLVIPDLRGYGRSDKPRGDAAHETYSKRTMARDQIATMAALGFDRFAVAGHDRGARVTYRLALDHPDAVTRIGILDIVPTYELWANATAASAMAAYHWYMLAQPEPLPEKLIAGDPGFYLRHCLKSWAAPGYAFDERDVADYVACFGDPASIHGSCEDYRSGWTRDRAYDTADHDAGRRIEQPMLVLWGEKSGFARANPLALWQKWGKDVRGHAVQGGHFVPEEAPDQTVAAFMDFFC
jgi:haloacetate dehalogenase